MPRDNRCMYMAHVCFMSVVVTCGSLWECLCVAVVKDCVFFPIFFPFFPPSIPFFKSLAVLHLSLSYPYIH